MRFYSDRPDVLTDVRWFFTEDDAPWVGVPNVFNSRVWYDGQPDAWPQLGEVEGEPRRWANGQAPASMQLERCELSFPSWLEGVPFSQAGIAPVAPSGVLFCCLGLDPMAVVTTVRSDDVSLNVAPSTGDVNAEINPLHSNAWQATQLFVGDGVSKRVVITTEDPPVAPAVLGTMFDIDASGSPSLTAVNVIGLIAGVPISILQVFGDGRTAIRAQLHVGPTFSFGDAVLSIGCRDFGAGLRLYPHAPGSFTGLFVNIVDSSEATLFAIGAGGQIMTNQHDSGTTLGSVIGRMLVYDENGSFLGYVPVYDGI